MMLIIFLSRRFSVPGERDRADRLVHPGLPGAGTPADLLSEAASQAGPGTGPTAKL